MCGWKRRRIGFLGLVAGYTGNAVNKYGGLGLPFQGPSGANSVSRTVAYTEQARKREMDGVLRDRIANLSLGEMSGRKNCQS